MEEIGRENKEDIHWDFREWAFFNIKLPWKYWLLQKMDHGRFNISVWNDYLIFQIPCQNIYIYISDYSKIF